MMMMTTMTMIDNQFIFNFRIFTFENLLFLFYYKMHKKNGDKYKYNETYK